MSQSDGNRGILIAVGLLLTIAAVVIAFIINPWAGAALLVAIAIPYFIYLSRVRRKNAAEMKTTLMPAIAGDLGTSLEASADTLSFERQGTVYKASLKWLSTEGAPSADFYVSFKLSPPPGLDFAIKYEPPWDNKYPKYPLVAVPNGPRGMTFHSPDEALLYNFLESGEILAEVSKYPDGLANRFGVIFANGQFDLTWRVFSMAEEEDPADAAENVRRVCTTAILFCDKIVKSGIVNRKS